MPTFECPWCGDGAVLPPEAVETVTLRCPECGTCVELVDEELVLELAA